MSEKRNLIQTEFNGKFAELENEFEKVRDKYQNELSHMEMEKSIFMQKFEMKKFGLQRTFQIRKEKYRLDKLKLNDQLLTELKKANEEQEREEQQCISQPYKKTNGLPIE